MLRGEKMKKTVSVVAVTSLLAATSALASGWRIPEQSVDSTAKAGANIASAKRADAAYFNPANMSWMEDTWHTEMDLSYIHLTSVEYDDSRTSLYDHESETENFLIPSGFLVSPDYNGVRFGLAIVAPYGLSKQWEEGYGTAFAEEFSLTTIELNPTVSYAINDKISVAGGIRMLYADAAANADASYIGVPLGRVVEGDTIEWGWNVAVDVRPTDKLNIAATYRSNIDMDFEEDIDLNLWGTLLHPTTTITIPCPAVLAFSVAYDVTDRLNVDFTWDRTFWSAYDELDFYFDPQLDNNPYEAAVARDWNDSNAFRIGVTYILNDTIELMAGFGYDQNPIPEENLDFSVPDSDAWLYSIGMQYKVNEQMELGIAALYDYKEERANNVDATGNVYGEFSNASAILLTVGMTYRF
jgi:long-chain fatty acid transport protein